MARRLLISLLGLGMSIVLRPTAVLAQQNVGPQNDSKKQDARNDLRGSDQSPIVVRVLPTTKTKEEAAQEEQSRRDQSAADWWMVKLTAAIGLIGLLQTLVFGWQGLQLKKTISKMDEIAQGQTKDMRASITEATRAAAAMEQVATSMAISASSVRESLDINGEIANTQKRISELQGRAYLSAEFANVVPQNVETGIRFEPRVALVNRGNTPAYRVKFSVRADVVPFPVPENFPFTLSEIPQDQDGSIIASTLNKILSAVAPVMYAESDVQRIKAGGDLRLMMWGKVTYDDAFGIARFVKFGFTFFWLTDGTSIMSSDTNRHNESN